MSNSETEKSLEGIKKITLCVWESKSKKSSLLTSGKSSPSKLLAQYGGLHAALILFRANKEQTPDYPFSKEMPKSAYPWYPVMSKYKGKQIAYSDVRTTPSWKHPDLRDVDAYVNFIPKGASNNPKKNNGMPIHSRSSHLEGNSFTFVQSSYDEAVEEYYEYRHGRSEGNQKKL